MTLEEKGPVVPPPQLKGFAEQVSKEIQSWADITAATHWNLYARSKPDGADFYIGQDELGHIHLNGEVHLATGKDLATVLIKKDLGKRFPYGSDWVTTSISTATEAAHALWLFNLNYKRIKGLPGEHLMHSIETYRMEH